MPIPVSLQDVVDELETISDETTAYLNRQTGELYIIADDELSRVEGDRDKVEVIEVAKLPDWQREVRAKAREVVNSKDWLALPTQFDLDGYRMMERFSRAVENEGLRTELLNSIRGQVAFRRFKAALFRHGVEDDWFRYRREALEEIEIEWLEEQKISFHRVRTGP
jgi:hypothetical protein